MINSYVIQFIVMVIIGMLFNPMNALVNNVNDLYFSLTLFYGGLLMASNMIWSHEIIHFITMGHFNKYVFGIGILLSILSVILLRTQLYVGGDQWLKRMIGHHSTALTTTKKLLENNNNFNNNSKLYRLAKSIILNQKLEIFYMKTMLK
jgi:hypothetical protein